MCCGIHESASRKIYGLHTECNGTQQIVGLFNKRLKQRYDNRYDVQFTHENEFVQEATAAIVASRLHTNAAEAYS